jgi:cytoskeletal protein CcmA (bactofilin family)
MRKSNMFRRSGKNSHDENGTYNDDPSPFSKYNAKKSDGDPPVQRMLIQDAHDGNWNITKTTPLPHHFEQLMAEETPETTLGAGVTFRGQLSFERFLRIDGDFEGDLLSQGKVVIGPTGSVKADLNLREAIIEGKVEGNITVQEKLELRGQATVKGDIRAKSLCVDEGVSISGIVLVGPHGEEA